MKTPILGGSYSVSSPNAAANRMVNLFPEMIPEGGKEPAFLTRAPGLKFKVTVGSGPIRGGYAFKGDSYWVSGKELYKVNSRWQPTLLGQVTGTSPVSMDDNGDQLFIACNPDGYIYTRSTGTLQKITDSDFPGAVTVGFLDGYFVFNEPNSQNFWITSLNDGTSIDATEGARAEGSPDNLVALRIDHREVWLFGTNSIEVWYNAGAPDFPLERIQGAFVETGCSAPYSIAKLDNSLFWLGSDARGTGIVFRATGYSPTRVSNHAVELAIRSYGDVSDAIAYSYHRNGHSFLVITFPRADKTWCYDVATQEWHERASFYDGNFHRHISNCHVVFNNENLVGDYRNGSIYAFDEDTYSDNGYPQKVVRAWRALPAGQNSLKRAIHIQLQLDCEMGVGLTSGQGSSPQVALRWSDDGGHNWSNEHLASLGNIGAFTKRAIWRQLGMTRDRIYEISITDPVKLANMGAELQTMQGNT